MLQCLCVFIRSELFGMSTSVLTANVKSALLLGWRERWPDERWSIAVKRHFPRGSTGDACQLAGEFTRSLYLEYINYLG